MPPNMRPVVPLLSPRAARLRDQVQCRESPSTGAAVWVVSPAAAAAEAAAAEQVPPPPPRPMQ